MSRGAAIAIGAVSGLVIAGVSAAAFGAARRGPGPAKGSSGTAKGSRPKGCDFERPIAVGMPDDPEIAELLDEMDILFHDMGVDLDVVDARQVTTMPKAPGQPVAIPPKAWWPNMAQTIVWGFQPIREALGLPIKVRGYRPPDYNEAVGGADCSRHQAFEGLDLYVESAHSSPAARRELAQLGAKLFIDHGKALQVGFGSYGYPHPSNIHIDVGHERRTWRDADKHIADVKSGKGPKGTLTLPKVAVA